MAMYGDIDQLSAGNKYGAQAGPVTEPYVAQSALGFGKAAFGYQGDPDSAVDVFNSSNKLTFAGVFVTGNVITVTVNGLTAAVTFTTDQATTMGLLVAAIEALDSSFSASFLSLVVNIETLGADCVPSVIVTLGATRTTGAAGTATTISGLVFLGAVVKQQKAPTADEASKTGFITGESLEVMRDGYLTVIVDDIANCAENKPVYVITSGANKGKFTGSSSGNLLLNADFHFLADKAAALAVVNFKQLPKVVA